MSTLREVIAAVGLGLRNRIQAGRVGELVDVDDEGSGVIEQMPDHGRADKAGAAGDEDDRVFKSHDFKAHDFLNLMGQNAVRLW